MHRLITTIKGIADNIYYCITTLKAKSQFWFNGISFGNNFKVRGNIILQISGVVKIGDNVRINSAFSANPISSGMRTSICVRGGVLKIGNETGISNSYFVCAKGIYIGDQVLIGAGCQFYDNDFHPLISEYRVGDKRDDSHTKSKEIIIENKVFIGASSIILKGTHIGEGAIIGAGSVVSGNVPPYEIWAGNPARYIKNTQ